jgi:hypothetical protein
MARSRKRMPPPQTACEPPAAAHQSGAPPIPPSRIGRLTPNDVRRLRRAAGNRAVVAPLQRQKDRGLYGVTEPANLRDETTHTVLVQLATGTEVGVEDKGSRQSKFRARFIENEHSWSVVGPRTGWIEDSKLTRLLQLALTDVT